MQNQVTGNLQQSLKDWNVATSTPGLLGDAFGIRKGPNNNVLAGVQSRPAVDFQLLFAVCPRSVAIVRTLPCKFQAAWGEQMCSNISRGTAYIVGFVLVHQEHT